MNITAGELLHQLEKDLSRVLVEPGNQDRLQQAREHILQQLATLDDTQKQTLLARATRRMPKMQSSPRLVSAPAQERSGAVDTEAAKTASAKAASLERQLREAENRESKLTSDLEASQQKISELEGELDKRFTQHRSLQKEHEQATRQLDAQRKQAEAANAQLQLRETELHGLRQELEQRHELLRQKDSRLTTIREERDEAQKSVTELENRLAALKNTQNPDADPARLSEQLAQAQERIRELEANKQAQPVPQAKPAPSPAASAAGGTTELLACKAFIEAMQERGLVEDGAQFTPTRERESQIGSIAALLASFLENTAKVILSHVDDLHVRQPRLAELAMPITYFQQEFGERVVWSLLARPQSAYDDPVVDLDTFLIPVRNLNICFLNAFQQVLVKHIKRVAHEELSPTRIGIAAKTRSASRLWAHYESQVAQQAPSAIADQCLEEFVALADRFYRRAG